MCIQEYTFDLSFVGRFVLFQRVLYRRFHCIWAEKFPLIKKFHFLLPRSMLKKNIPSYLIMFDFLCMDTTSPTMCTLCTGWFKIQYTSIPCTKEQKSHGKWLGGWFLLPVKLGYDFRDSTSTIFSLTLVEKTGSKPQNLGS